MNERLRIAIYTRVSTEDQAKEGYSLEVQRESSPDFFEIKAGRTMYLESFAQRAMGYQQFQIIAQT
jgi:DNA invertase Pin-like site-specific DNA recombinase